MEQGLPASSETRAFAAELLSRVPRAGAAAGGAAAAAAAAAASRAAEREAAALARRSYSLVAADEGEAPAAAPPPTASGSAATAAAAAAASSAAAATQCGAKRAHGRRRGGGGEEEEDAEAVEARKRARGGDAPPPVPRWEAAEAAVAEGAEAAAEAAREADLADKAAFEARLKARDDAKTTKLTEKKLSAEAAEEAVRRGAAVSTDERALLMPTLREVSRQAYLKKRETGKLEELREALEDEEYLFAGEAMTAKERAELDYKRQVFALASQHAKDAAAAAEEGYKLPEAYDAPGAERRDRRYAVALDRYKETAAGAVDDSNPFKEQEAWEKHQMGHAEARYGARDGKGLPPSSVYELVFEDQIHFIKDALLAGDADEAGKGGGGEPAIGEAEAAERARRTAHEQILADRKLLPIFAYREQLLAAVAAHQVVVIVGETGSGKTTQIPQYMHEAGYSARGKVGCTQPRRVAAMSVAARVAQEMDIKLGAEVGYSIRFEDCTSDKTVLKYMTDGMLLREFLGEPDLGSYSVMMVDEAHERTLHTDVLFGLVKDIARFRPDIKLLISSATLDAEKFSEYFDYAPIFRIPGRRYPVDILYTKAPEADYLEAAVVTVLQTHVTQPPGDILVFFTGQDEIETAEEALKQRTRGAGSKLAEMIICPIYANLPSDLQARIFEPTPPGARKVVLATSAWPRERATLPSSSSY